MRTGNYRSEYIAKRLSDRDADELRFSSGQVGLLRTEVCGRSLLEVGGHGVRNKAMTPPITLPVVAASDLNKNAVMGNYNYSNDRMSFDRDILIILLFFDLKNPK